MEQEQKTKCNKHKTRKLQFTAKIQRIIIILIFQLIKTVNCNTRKREQKED